MRIPRYNEQGERRCSRCGLYMGVEQFYVWKHAPDGYDRYCILCRNAANRDYYARHRERCQELSDAWRKRNMPRVRKARRERERMYRAIARIERKRQEAS